MASFGYFLSSEELAPADQVRWAQRAETAGFDRLWISDHYHPWNDEQGESSFVWGVIGGIAATTELHVTTAVTCPTVRIHPAVIAQAAATSSLLLQGRFALGVGTGEFLNEHILGDHWPPAPERLEMLREAVEVMRRLWTGEWVTHDGDHYLVEDARIYSCPSAPVPVYVSGFGPKSISLAAEIGEGYMTTQPSAESLSSYRDQSGKGPGQAGSGGGLRRGVHLPDGHRAGGLLHLLGEGAAAPPGQADLRLSAPCPRWRRPPARVRAAPGGDRPRPVPPVPGPAVRPPADAPTPGG